MAKRHKSALKAHRHSEKRRLINKSNKSRMRTALKAVRAQVAEGTIEGQGALSTIYSMLDKMIHKGVIHRNTAARYKSRLTKKVAPKPGAAHPS